MIAFAAALAIAAAHHVQVADDVFIKDAVTVKKGAIVQWDWVGKGRHNVIVSAGPVSFHSATKKHGTYARKMTKRGTYQLLCSVHPKDMKMTLTVK
jgi:plastocyanin